jgi:hypothetical protein
VEVDGDVEGDGGFEDGGEARVVEEEAFGGAVEQGSGEVVGLDAALEFFRGGFRIFEGKTGKGGEAGGIGTDGGGGFVVDVAGEGVAVWASSASMPMAARETTWRSIPASSMAARRPWPRSSSLGWSAASHGGVWSP